MKVKITLKLIGMDERVFFDCHVNMEKISETKAFTYGGKLVKGKEYTGTGVVRFNPDNIEYLDIEYR